MDKLSLLNESHDAREGALCRMFDEAYSAVGNDRPHSKDAAHTTTEFLKAGSLLIPSLWGKGLSALVFAADEVRHDDPQKALTDMGVGAVKGATLHSIGQAVIFQRITPIAQGVFGGLSSRLADKALSPTTYEHPLTHNFDGPRALFKIASEIGNVPALVTDATAAKFAASALGKTAEAVEEKTHLGATISGALKTFIKQGTQNTDTSINHRDQFNAVKALETLMVPTTPNAMPDDPNAREADHQRAARIATIELVERFIMGQSQGFENTGKNGVYKQLLDFIRRAKYVNSLPASKAG